MSDSNPVSTPPGIVDRAKAIILRQPPPSP